MIEHCVDESFSAKRFWQGHVRHGLEIFIGIRRKESLLIMFSVLAIVIRRDAIHLHLFVRMNQ